MSTASQQRCPRCQAPLASDAAVCPQCGLSRSASSEESNSTNSLPLLPPVAAESDGVQSSGVSPSMSAENLQTPTYDAPTAVQMGEPDASSLAAVDTPPAGLWQPGQFFSPPVPPPQPKKHLGRKAILIAVALLVLLGASGGLAYILTRPNPAISVTSAAGESALSGSPDTILHVSGHNFTSDVAITFLLDGSPAPGASKAHSDTKGNVQADLTITDDWSFGAHVLTARDAENYVTRTGVSLKVIPAPVITLSSSSHVGEATAISQALSIHASGKRFSPQSTITFLLDGNPLPDAQPLTSDAKGRFEVDLSPTNWALGNHTLTAKDSQGYSLQQPLAVVVVIPGQAGTPGPNGAPADNATFTLSITVQHQDTLNSQPLDPFQIFLKITGRPDPAGGLPCDATFDDGQPHTFTGSLGGGLTYTETDTYGCSGSYQSGKLKYVEVLLNEKMVISNGDTCNSGNINFPYRTYEGTFTNATTISGTYIANGLIIPCTGSFDIHTDPEKGTWTGSM